MLNKEIEQLLENDSDKYVFEEIEERLKSIINVPEYYDPILDEMYSKETLEKIRRARTIKFLILHVESVKEVEKAYNRTNILEALKIWKKLNNYEFLKTELKRIEEKIIDPALISLLALEK